MLSSSLAFKVAGLPSVKAVEAVRKGLPASAFDGMARALSLTAEELAANLGISLRTVRDQRKRQVRLSSEVTEKLVRTARLHELARRLFTTDEAVSEWLASPALGLDGRTPLSLLDTEIGAREVESLLQGIAHGNVI